MLCIDCFKKISPNATRCKSCHKKLIKKEISNIQVESTYELSREKIKRHTESLIKLINKELEKMCNLNKFILNEKNSKILNSKMAQIVEFKENIQEAWVKTFQKDLKDNPEEIEKLLKRENNERF